MHLQRLTLTNIRQFASQTFEFRPGFNLLVGENGAGKTTILRSLLAMLGSAQQMGRRPRLEDEDIRLRARHAEVRITIHSTYQGVEEFQFQKTLWEPARRSVRQEKLPLTLHYSSNEAICAAMRMKRTKRIRDVGNDSFQHGEEFLYMSERDFSQEVAIDTEGQFGNSRSVRKFVNRVLFTFSPEMSEFYWRFEPYDCSIVPIKSAKKMPLTAEVQRLALAVAMRYFDIGLTRRKRPFDWPDQAKIVLTPNDSERKRSDRNLPYLRDIWESMKISSADREFLLSCSLEVKLTPRIMIRRETGALRLNQLSDGEQRLFSLFVDIARQLSINNPKYELGTGEAIVLIDEIDVHLHPKWQRLIVPALEDLFPNCQFIATTHSPFVIQATHRELITTIGTRLPNTSIDGGNSIEDIAEEIQGVSVPQRSVRAEILNKTAKRYFTLLERQAGNSRQVTRAELLDAEQDYREASEPFTSDPAVHALLKVLTIKNKNQ